MVAAQCPLAGPGGPPLRRLAADAAGLSGARRRAGERPRKRRRHARLQPRQLGRRHPPRPGLPAARPHDRLWAVFPGLVAPLVRPSGGHYPDPTGESVPCCASVRTTREALLRGDLVCIFPEGGLTRTGQMQEFRPGFLSMMKGTDAPVVPVYLGGLWGSIFSFEGGRFFWKWPRRLPYPVTIHFGRPLPRPADVAPVRQAVEQLGTQAMQQRPSYEMNLPRKFLRTCRGAMLRSKVADSSGADLTGAKLLMGTLVLRRVLRREVLDRRRSSMVGLLLPPSVGSVLANTALAHRPPHRRQSELHRLRRRDEPVHRPVRHSPRADQPAAAGAISAEDRRRGGLPRRPQEEDHAGRQADRRRPGVAAAGGRAGALARPDADQNGRPADGDVHLGLDRPAQGRHAHPSQRRLERRGVRRDRPPRPNEDVLARRAADVPFLRLHRRRSGRR